MIDVATIAIGQRVMFLDANATTSTDELGLVVGVCNGEPRPPVDDIGTWVLPVFAPRDNGRENTTIFVHERNIVEVFA